MEKNKAKVNLVTGTTSKQVGTTKQNPVKQTDKNSNTQKKSAPSKEDLQKSKNTLGYLINDYKNLEN
jgi:hypothetical protein